MKQFRLTKKVDADFLTQTEAVLYSIFRQRLLAYRDRFNYPKIYRASFGIAKLASLLGLTVSLAALTNSDVTFQSAGQWLGLILFFLLSLALTWDAKRLEATRRKLFGPYWAWLAKKNAGRLLKRARKVAPFVAEYDFRGNLAVYYRTQHETSDLAWARRLSGHRIVGNGFTLFYKTEKSLQPYAIILHEPSIELDLYLDELGIRSINYLAAG